MIADFLIAVHRSVTIFSVMTTVISWANMIEMKPDTGIVRPLLFRRLTKAVRHQSAGSASGKGVTGTGKKLLKRLFSPQRLPHLSRLS